MAAGSRARLPRKRLVYVVIVNALVTAGVLVIAPAAEAHITKVEITATESPTFGGHSWPGVGQYEKIVGRAFGVPNPQRD